MPPPSMVKCSCCRHIMIPFLFNLSLWKPLRPHVNEGKVLMTSKRTTTAMSRTNLIKQSKKVRSRVDQQKKRYISTAQVFRIFQKTFQAKRPTVASQHFCTQKLSIFRPATHRKNTRKIEKYFHFSFLDPVVMATSSPSAIARAVSQSFSTEKCPTQTPSFCVRWENTIRCCTRYAIQAASVGKISYTHTHTEPACVSLSQLQN